MIKPKIKCRGAAHYDGRALSCVNSNKVVIGRSNWMGLSTAGHMSREVHPEDTAMTVRGRGRCGAFDA
jgi:hypothetical protein